MPAHSRLTTVTKLLSNHPEQEVPDDLTVLAFIAALAFNTHKCIRNSLKALFRNILLADNTLSVSSLLDAVQSVVYHLKAVGILGPERLKQTSVYNI